MEFSSYGLTIVVCIAFILIGGIAFIVLGTRSWGVNWWTWLLAKPFGSIRSGFVLILVLMLFFLLTGYFLGMFM